MWHRNEEDEDVEADICRPQCVSLGVDIDWAGSLMLTIPTPPKESGWTTDEWLGQPASEGVAKTNPHEDVALNFERFPSEDAHIEHKD